MSTAPTWFVAAHAVVASLSLTLGALQLVRRRYGDPVHRVLGRMWVVGMAATALSSFWIREIDPGAFSILHALSVVTLVSITWGFVAIRLGRVPDHRGSMIGAYLGIVGAFVGAVAVPSRDIPTFAVDQPLGFAAVVLAVLVTTAALALVGRALTRDPAAASAGTEAAPRMPIASLRQR